LGILFDRRPASGSVSSSRSTLDSSWHLFLGHQGHWAFSRLFLGRFPSFAEGTAICSVLGGGWSGSGFPGILLSLEKSRRRGGGSTPPPGSDQEEGGGESDTPYPPPSRSKESMWISIQACARQGHRTSIGEGLSDVLANTRTVYFLPRFIFPPFFGRANAQRNSRWPILKRGGGRIY